MGERRLLTVEEIATALRVSKMTVYRLIREGELRTERIGRQFRVPPENLEAYLQRNYADYRQRYTTGPVDL
jgi:excisionase family DNA binding protein